MSTSPSAGHAPRATVAGATPAGNGGSAAAVTALNRALAAGQISHPAYGSARRLLDLAGADGVCTLPRQALPDLFLTPSLLTVRRQLADLSSAGVIRYMVRGDEVFVRFLACTASPAQGQPEPGTHGGPARVAVSLTAARRPCVGRDSIPASAGDR